jgi:serine/threonine protein phosphatase 1
MSRTFVIGDIHGAYRALRQCLEKSGFDHQDRLICLGDVSDGWPETKQCIDFLLEIDHLTYLLGNHDLWTYQWMLTGKSESMWLNQGGEATVKSYTEGVPSRHIEFFQKALPYYLENNKLFVHAGIDPRQPLEEQDLDTFLWDRSLVHQALELYKKNINTKLTSFDEVFVGHTPILSKQPLQSCDVWLMDTGAGWSGVLSMMNIDSKESFVSDAVPTLYPGVAGRGGK